MKKLVLFLQPQDNQSSIELSLTRRVHALIFESNTLNDVSDNSTNAPEVFFDQSLDVVLEHLSKDIQSSHVRSVLVIPGENILKCELKVPAKQFKQVQKALPYLIEDQIASDPEDCFIAIGEHKDDLLSCAIIQKDILAQYHAFLLDKNLNVEKILSDDALLCSDNAVLHVFENRAFMCTAQGSTFVFDLSLLDIYLAKFKPLEKITENHLEQNDDNLNQITSADLDESALTKEILTINYYAETDEVLTSLKQQVISDIERYKKDQGFDYDIEQFDKSVESFYLDSAKTALDRQKQNKLINFLQGEYKVKRIGSGFKLDINWKPIAYLLSAFVVLYLVSIFVETKKYEHAAEQAEMETKTVFEEIFPKTKNYSRMKERVSSLLKGSVEPSDNQFLQLFFLFSEAMQSINALNPDSLKPLQIQYEQSSGELKVDVIALDFDTLNSLKEKADKGGLILEISSSNTEKTGLKGRLKVKLKP